MSMQNQTRAGALLAAHTANDVHEASRNTPEVIKVADGEWAGILKDKNIKTVSMVGGRDGADYEIIYKDHSSKLYKFA